MNVSNLYNRLCELGKSKKVLYHYTNLSGMDAILKNNSLRLSRLDMVNDPREHTRMLGLWKYKVYVACFTNTLDNESYFYREYGPIRLTIFPTQHSPSVFRESECINAIEKITQSDINYKRYNRLDDWGIYDISFADILYVNGIHTYLSDNGDPICPGLLKERHGHDNNGNARTWEQEQETRFRVSLRPKGLEFGFDRTINEITYYRPFKELKYLYIPIPGIILKADISNAASDENKEKFNILCSKYDLGSPPKLS